MKIVVLDGFVINPGDLSWEKFKTLGEFTYYDRTKPHETIERIGDAELVITNKTVISKEVIKSCKNIKYIGVLATGFNVVDTAFAKENNIIVTNIPDYSSNSVAQLIFALLLEYTNGVRVHNQSVMAGEWANSLDFSYQKTPQIELFGKTLGIVGFGTIGKKVAKIANAMGLNVIATNRSGIIDCEYVKYADLEILLKTSDIISLNCPLTAENTGLICTKTISKMKDGIILINTARGALVNEADVANALTSGKIALFATDVLTTEPPKADNPLLSSPNCIITPHIGFTTSAARARLMDIAFNNLQSFLNKNPINVVN